MTGGPRRSPARARRPGPETSDSLAGSEQSKLRVPGALARLQLLPRGCQWPSDSESLRFWTLRLPVPLALAAGQLGSESPPGRRARPTAGHWREAASGWYGLCMMMAATRGLRLIAVDYSTAPAGASLSECPPPAAGGSLLPQWPRPPSCLLNDGPGVPGLGFKASDE